MMDLVANIVGMIGVSVLLIAYYLLQIERIPGTSVSFSFCNFLGALMILFSLMYHWNLSSVLIEIAWALISLYGVFKALRRKKVFTEKSEKFEPVLKSAD